MKRLVCAVFVIALLASGLIAATKPELQVDRMGWKVGEYLGDDYHWCYITGRLTNNGTRKFRRATLCFSVIDLKTREKIRQSPVAVVENLQPGDKAQWTADDPVCVYMPPKGPKVYQQYAGRLELIESVEEPAPKQ